MAPRLQRRGFLIAAGLLLAGGAAWRVLAPAPGRHEALPADSVLALVDEDMALEIGRRYLDGHPTERSVEALTRLLPARGDARRVEAAIAADFAGDDVGFEAGWLVSRTEARLAALRVLEPTAL